MKSSLLHRVHHLPTISILPATLPTNAHPTVIAKGKANTLVLAPILTLDL